MKNLKLVLLFSIIILYLKKKKIIEGSTNSDQNIHGCRPNNPTATSSVRELCSRLNTESECNSGLHNECEWIVRSITTSDPDNTNEFSSDGSSSSHTQVKSGVEGGITSSSGISGEKDNTTDIIIAVSLTLFVLGLSGFLIYKYS